MMREIKEFMTLESYMIVEEKGDAFVVRGEDDIEKVCCLKDNVFFASVACAPLDSMDPAKVGEIKDALLDAGNGIATSHFKMIQDGGSKVITLNSMCTLQNMGDEDCDDIRSVLQYLSDDVKAAHKLLAPFRKTTVPAR